jgi:hypothetical protein
MCFVLYAGTTTPLPRRSFDKYAPAISVESLTERDTPIRQHFRNPEVQYIGSTSGCGCDFPHATLQNGQWPELEIPEDVEKDELDIARGLSDHHNREALVNLLRTSGNKMIELYGVGDGDFATPPKAQEDISVDKLLDPHFHFKEQGFYRVYLDMLNEPPNSLD